MSLAVAWGMSGHAEWADFMVFDNFFVTSHLREGGQPSIWIRSLYSQKEAMEQARSLTGAMETGASRMILMEPPRTDRLASWERRKIRESAHAVWHDNPPVNAIIQRVLNQGWPI